MTPFKMHYYIHFPIFLHMTVVAMVMLDIATKVVSSNPIHGEVYLMQHYVIKFISDLRQVGGFLHQ